MAKNDRKLRVFFSAPSISDDEKKELFVWLRGEILKTGVELTYDWITDEKSYGPMELYTRTAQGIYQADLVIAELSFPSTGVGQQVGMALTRRIPVLGLMASWKNIPRKFTAGAESDIFRVVDYTKNDIGQVLRKNLKSFGKERFVKFNFISTLEINETLEEKSVKLGMSRSQLLRKIIRDWMNWNYGE